MSLWELEDGHSCRGTPRPARESPAEEARTAELQMKVDFFRKLGYSSAEIDLYQVIFIISLFLREATLTLKF